MLALGAAPASAEPAALHHPRGPGRVRAQLHRRGAERIERRQAHGHGAVRGLGHRPPPGGLGRLGRGAVRRRHQPHGRRLGAVRRHRGRAGRRAQRPAAGAPGLQALRLRTAPPRSTSSSRRSTRASSPRRSRSSRSPRPPPRARPSSTRPASTSPSTAAAASWRSCSTAPTTPRCCAGTTSPTSRGSPTSPRNDRRDRQAELSAVPVEQRGPRRRAAERPQRQLPPAARLPERDEAAGGAEPEAREADHAAVQDLDGDVGAGHRDHRGRRRCATASRCS